MIISTPITTAREKALGNAETDENDENNKNKDKSENLGINFA